MTSENHLANGDSRPYWEAAAEGKLVFQKCVHCGSVQFPPRHQCASCWKADLEWTEATGRGKVESFTIVHRAPLPIYRDKVPYVVASIITDEGLRMISNIVGKDALIVAIGDEVKVAFEPGAEGITLPVFHRN